jgi:hypothetical protein
MTMTEETFSLPLISYQDRGMLNFTATAAHIKDKTSRTDNANASKREIFLHITIK